jgi:hypothetical protein
VERKQTLTAERVIFLHSEFSYLIDFGAWC